MKALGWGENLKQTQIYEAEPRVNRRAPTLAELLTGR